MSAVNIPSTIQKPRVYKEPHPFARSHPWRARVAGLSWPARTWDDAMERVAELLPFYSAAVTPREGS